MRNNLFLDFFQDLSGQTCTQWLTTFLDGYKRDGEQKSALSRIFPEISCSTVFLPHSELEGLRHLDQVPDGVNYLLVIPSNVLAIY
jgi:hypothetical protein